MMCVIDNHIAFLRYIVYLNILSGLCFIQACMSEAIFRRVCINNATLSSKVNIPCDSRTYRIEVLSIYYDHCQTFSDTCTTPSAPCNHCHYLFTSGHRLKERALYGCSSNLQCLQSVNNLQDAFDTLTNCANITPNFVLMEYHCVPATDFIDLCGDEGIKTISTTKHLAYFRKHNDSQFQNCTCSIQGPHDLTAVHAGIPQSKVNNGRSGNLHINWKHKNNNIGEQNVNETGVELINMDFTEMQSSRIRLIHNCTRLTPPVWFKIKPNTGQSVHIQCGQSVGNTPSTSSPSDITPSNGSRSTMTSPPTTSVMAHDISTTVAVTSSTSHSEETPNMSTDDKSTTSMTTNGISTTLTVTSSTSHSEETSNMSSSRGGENNTLSPEERNTKVPLIVGSVIGGLFLVIVIAVIGFLLIRCRRRKRSPVGSGSFKGDVELTNTYDEIFGQTHQTYANNGLRDSGPDYSSPGEAGTITDNSNGMIPPGSSLEYDQLQPTTVLQTFQHKCKMATLDEGNEPSVYDHTRNQLKSGTVHSGIHLESCDYDVLENKANLKSSFGSGEVSHDDIYSHVDENHSGLNNGTQPPSPKVKDKTSEPEYAAVQHNFEKERTSPGVRDDNNIIGSTLRTKGANLYYILEKPNPPEIRTGPNYEGSDYKTDEDAKGIFPPETSVEYDQLKPATVVQTLLHQNKKPTHDQVNEAVVYDHTSNPPKRDNVYSDNNAQDGDYDILENKNNLKASIHAADAHHDDTYSHVDGNHSASNNDTFDPPSSETKGKMAGTSEPEYETVQHNFNEQRASSGKQDEPPSPKNKDKKDKADPEYATVNKHKIEEQSTSAVEDDNRTTGSSLTSNGANRNPIVEKPNTPNTRTGPVYLSSDHNADTNYYSEI